MDRQAEGGMNPVGCSDIFSYRMDGDAESRTELYLDTSYSMKIKPLKMSGGRGIPELCMVAQYRQ